MLPIKITTTIFTVIILTLLVCFIFFRSPPDESSPRALPVCKTLLTEIYQMEEQYGLSIPSTFVFLFNDEKFAVHKDNFNTVVTFITKKYGITLSQTELGNLWSDAATEATRKCTVLMNIKNPITFKAVLWEIFVNSVRDLIKQKCAALGG